MQNAFLNCGATDKVQHLQPGNVCPSLYIVSWLFRRTTLADIAEISFNCQQHTLGYTHVECATFKSLHTFIFINIYRNYFASHYARKEEGEIEREKLPLAADVAAALH